MTVLFIGLHVPFHVYITIGFWVVCIKRGTSENKECTFFYLSVRVSTDLPDLCKGATTDYVRVHTPGVLSYVHKLTQGHPSDARDLEIGRAKRGAPLCWEMCDVVCGTTHLSFAKRDILVAFFVCVSSMYVPGRTFCDNVLVSLCQHPATQMFSRLARASVLRLYKAAQSTPKQRARSSS